MANFNAPLGFCPIKHEYGTIERIEYYTIAAGVTLFKGSPCIIDASGLAAAFTNTAALTGGVLGVSAGHGTAGQSVAIYTDPNQLYELQADDNTLTNVAAYRGALFRLTTPTTGNATTLNSKCQLDASTGATLSGTTAATVTPVRVEDRVFEIGSTIGGSTAVSWTRFAVRFIPPVMHKGMGGIGLNITHFRGI